MSAEKGGGTSVWGIFPGKMSGEYFQGECLTPAREGIIKALYFESH